MLYSAVITGCATVSASFWADTFTKTNNKAKAIIFFLFFFQSVN